MRITIQYFDGCPHWRLADQRVRQVAGSGADIDYERIDSPEMAERVRFHGSPTILVDDHDPFVTGEELVGLSCRVFRTEAGPDGAPSLAQLQAALLT